MPELKKAQVKWVEKMRFVGISNSGRSIVMDGPPSIGGDSSSVTPGELVFIALGGCTGIDIVTILNKMHVPFNDLKIEIEGEQIDTHPKIYSWVKITYRFYGVADQAKARQAVELSQEKYCFVSAIIGKSAKLSYEIIFED